MGHAMQTSSRSPQGARAGFTLPELLIVVVIIGISARLLVPAFSSLGTSGRLSGAANVIQQDLQYTRLQAIRRGTTASFRTSTSTPNAYTITVESNGTIVRTVKSGSLSDYKNVTILNDSSIVTFNSRGLLSRPDVSSSATGYARIKLTRGTKSDSVLVYANGRIYHART
jgi:prepilin-type N-terminal cleavage/methylation domain-containing protein